jgi:cell division protease FtsH
MVCQYGMSNLGPLAFGERDDLIFLGKELAMHKNFSEKTAELIDDEVRKIVTRNFDRAKDLVENNKDKLVKIAEALLEKEVLDSDEIEAIVHGKKLKKKVAKKKEPKPEESKKDSKKAKAPTKVEPVQA